MPGCYRICDCGCSIFYYYIKIVATALEKFMNAMNGVSPFWTKNVEIQVQNGEIVLIKCEGFHFKSDDPKKELLKIN